MHKYGNVERPYWHSKLGDQQIRILCIPQGNGGDNILGVVKNVNFTSDFREYVVLWEDLTQEKHTIWIGSYPFIVLHNLYTALPQLHDTSTTRKL